MTYVMSCLNGCYSDFLKMLKIISFGKKDVLFLLGDVSDTGEEPMELLCDLSFRENVWPVCGDRDAAAGKMLSGFERMLKSGETPDKKFIAEMNEWAAGGGRVALDAFRTLDEDMKEGVLDYLADFAPYDTVHVGDTDYLLVHSGIAGYREGRDLDDYPEEAFRTDGEKTALSFPGMTVVCGGRPIGESFTPESKIRRSEGLIELDCGAGHGGRLGCLRLDDGAEFYV